MSVPQGRYGSIWRCWRRSSLGTCWGVPAAQAVCKARAQAALQRWLGVTHPARLLVLLELEHALVGTLAFEFSTSNEQIQSQTIYYSPREPPYAMAVSGKEF